jgi:outer membrane protein TolC
VTIAAEARHAFFAAVAAQELVAYARQVKDAADASGELARRMVQAGNFSKLAQMREQAFYADATVQLARTQQQAVADRERLVRVLGLLDASQLKLPERLPDLPKATLDPKDAEQTAIDTRLDVLQAKKAAEAVARSLELTRVTGFINVLHAGYANKSQTGEARKNGYDIELELPLFDFGATRIARAESTYMQALQRTAEVAVDARSQVRETYAAYRTAHDLARHYREEVVPLRQKIAEENLLRYNGMLISVFELLADARDQVASITASIEASRDFWLADTDLQTALTGTSPGALAALGAGGAAPAAETQGH